MVWIRVSLCLFTGKLDYFCVTWTTLPIMSFSKKLSSAWCMMIAGAHHSRLCVISYMLYAMWCHFLVIPSAKSVEIFFPPSSTFTVAFKYDSGGVVFQHIGEDCYLITCAVHQMMFTFWYRRTVIINVWHPAVAVHLLSIHRELYLTFALVWWQVHFIDNPESPCTSFTPSKQAIPSSVCVCVCKFFLNILRPCLALIKKKKLSTVRLSHSKVCRLVEQPMTSQSALFWVEAVAAVSRVSLWLTLIKWAPLGHRNHPQKVATQNWVCWSCHASCIISCPPPPKTHTHCGPIWIRL